MQVQAVPSVGKGRLEDLEGDARQVFHGRDAVDDDGFVVRAGWPGSRARPCLFVDEEGVVPDVDQVLLGQRLDVGSP
jgi:hypothetical protein